MVVLLLNASYEPLSVISTRKAVGLWLRGRVEPASESAERLTSGSRVLEIPHVLRLRRYVNAPQRGVAWSRQAILRRDRYRCIYCGVQAGDYVNGQIVARSAFTIDHIMPRSRGGRNTWGNTAAACAACNQRKADRLPHEAGMRLLWEPRHPRVDYYVLSGSVPEAWRIYLETK